jgi:hypothetical protein
MKTVLPLSPSPNRKTRHCSLISPVRQYPAHCRRNLRRSLSPHVNSFINFKNSGHECSSATSAGATAVVIVTYGRRPIAMYRPVRRSMIPVGVPSSQASASNSLMPNRQRSSPLAYASTLCANLRVLNVFFTLESVPPILKAVLRFNCLTDSITPVC